MENGSRRKKFKQKKKQKTEQAKAHNEISFICHSFNIKCQKREHTLLNRNKSKSK